MLAPALVAAAASFATAHPTHAQTTPVGRWNTISDVDGKPAAVVEIREVDGQFVGVITRLLRPDDDTAAVCDACRDERKGKRIIGLEILRGMRPDGDEWSGGEILDPESGKTYKAKMHLENGGKQLLVRGYIGFSLFGRSQTWQRASDRDAASPIAGRETSTPDRRRRG
jgi:uncharacterized protein (DUF2147 family)